ncbi:MAG: hypothetical protein ACK5UG_02635, partial [Synechococcaceae cyanobacterium]
RASRMGAGSWQRMSRALVIALWVAVTAAPMASRADETYILCGPKSVGFIRAKGQTACLGGGLDWRSREAQRQAAEAQKRAAEAQRQAAEAQREAAKSRTITQKELNNCRGMVMFNLKDPSSYKEWIATTEKGGIIDYTATATSGGPVRETVRCTDILDR